jgi:conjugative transfer region protein TrbK
MMPHRTSRQIARIAAVGLVAFVVTFAIVRSRHSEQAAVPAPPEHEDAEAHIQELARCRTITSEETAALDTCRRLWAENRRQFFGSARLPQSSINPVPNAPATPMKNQDRVSPPVAPQEGEAR